MPKKIDEKGNRYGRLLVLEEKGVPKDKKNKSITWLCLCDCGNDAIVSGEYLRKGQTKSCGCLRGDINGISTHPLYKTWYNMVGRCHNSRLPKYKSYGGRGIYVYSPWREDFYTFSKWIEENLGSKSKAFTLDRIDNNVGYVPGNLRWASVCTQLENRQKLLSKEEEKILLLFAKPIVFKCPKENEDKNGTQQAHY